ncbi:SDR family NAD(P)-dependent oxidoreductase [Streptomyces qinzhouensis]|uniref:SDR family oxidoreductase n=1 Tax=Streptomyces qinzhouensis TaxID=2599401 RepID=A0A5B8J3M4_9ACTN|nr:SDR family oxidoreductase [Streptomyces qinzhouensis]QDY75836.1 SDR family oxidoreductase [Streptomyces qinzhouensis]
MSALQGKVALVTGGSRGIGAAIVRSLAREGADVAFTYVSATSEEKAKALVAEVEAAGRRAIAVAADSAVPEAVTAAVGRTVAELGRLDVLVNNAGIFPYGPVEDVSAEELDRVLAVHVKAPFTAVQAALPHLPEGGRIISVGTNFTDRATMTNIALYTMSKAALGGLTRALARELGPRGITVNTVNPGPTATDMNPVDGEGAEEVRTSTALGSFLTPEDIAATVVHLAGPGGRLITGTAITVDAGVNA